VIYDGYVNTYSLKHNGKSLILAALPPPKPQKAKLSKESKKSPTIVKYGKSTPLIRESL